MRGKNRFVLLFAILLVLSVSGVFALNANFTNITGSVERALDTVSSTNIINFTIGAESENITQVQFVVTGSQNTDPDKFISNSNGTSSSALSVTFTVSNSTNYSMQGGSYALILTYTGNGPISLIPNGTKKNFWFNVNSRSQASSFFSVYANASTGSQANTNSTAVLSWPFTFRFSGYVKNESGGLQADTNVSIYEYSESQSGPLETLITQTKTGTDGSFSLSGINSAGAKLYKLKIIYYNQSDLGQALKIGTNLPQFPAEMYYPKIYTGIFGGDVRPEFNFMRQPSFNGTTFYVGPAATINISTTNGTAPQRFGYMVMEQGTGFPLESNPNTNITSALVVVPTNRQYTVMVMRNNNIFGMSYAVCADGSFMNDTACRTPPKSNSTVYPTNDGQIINLNISLVISRKNMVGCIGVNGNASATTNVSLILPKMMPWTGFIPPARADVQSMNLSDTSQLNYTDYRCPGKIAWYNISVLNSDYFVEFYGRNDSASNGADFVGALQNASFTSGNQNINITLVPLIGSFYNATSSEVSQNLGTNTTKFTIRVLNSSGGAITQDRPHIEVNMKNSSMFGEITYIAEATNGSFVLTIPRGVIGKVKVFSNNAPPKEKALNLSQSELNITLINMQGGDGGFRRKNSSGQLESMNISQDSFNVGLGFFRTGGTCDSIEIDSSCNLTSMGARDFNPLIALVAGKVNMEMRLSSGVGIIFYNFDMFAAKQPPMESVMNNQATSGGSSANQAWEFGSFVPADVYDYAIVKIPYSDSVINDSASVNMSLPVLYDENWNAVWNSSAGDTVLNLTSSIDDYLGSANNRSYNSSIYRNMLINGGIICSKTNSTITGSNPNSTCYVNTNTNVIYVRVPHFSGISPSVSGSAPSTSSGTDTTDTGGGLASTNPESYWTATYTLSEDQFNSGFSQNLASRGRIRFTVNGTIHSVGIVNLTETSATINISSTPQQAIFNVGESKKFELTDDNYYDIKVTLNGIASNRANISIVRINELIPVVSTPATPQTTTEKIQEKIGEITQKAVDKGSLFWIIVVVIIIAIIVVGIVIKKKIDYMMKKKGFK